jgi:hypothetical protein
MTTLSKFVTAAAVGLALLAAPLAPASAAVAKPKTTHKTAAAPKAKKTVKTKAPKKKVAPKTAKKPAAKPAPRRHHP